MADETFFLDIKDAIHCPLCKKPVTRLEVLHMGMFEWTVSPLCERCQTQRAQDIEDADRRHAEERALVSAVISPAE